ncbi:MAG TPA: DUF1801 domain-containing protein [Planctomycetota bacterium]|nr:DUF1801 domain-containing protein [Planctomycetota bacterium]
MNKSKTREISKLQQCSFVHLRANGAWGEAAMKKSMSKGAKPAPKPKSVEEYLAQVPAPGRRTLQAVRARIRAALPVEATERLSWGMPSFALDGCLVCYAAFKDHCSLFPMSRAVVKRLLPKLKKYAASTGTIRFPLDKPLPAGLVKAIVKTRLAQRSAQRASRVKQGKR